MCQDESVPEESDVEDVQSGKRVTFSLFDVSWYLQFLLKEKIIYRQIDMASLDKFMLALWCCIPTYKNVQLHIFWQLCQ
jgi:hypothetical protein